MGRVSVCGSTRTCRDCAALAGLHNAFALRHRTGPIPDSMSSLRHGYQIVARCDGSHRGLVEGAMRWEFAASPLQVERIDAEVRVYGPFARIRMHVRASNAKRSGRQRGGWPSSTRGRGSQACRRNGCSSSSPRGNWSPDCHIGVLTCFPNANPDADPCDCSHASTARSGSR